MAERCQSRRRGRTLSVEGRGLTSITPATDRATSTPLPNGAIASSHTVP
jgi:hypothetical protein